MTMTLSIDSSQKTEKWPINFDSVYVDCERDGYPQYSSDALVRPSPAAADATGVTMGNVLRFYTTDYKWEHNAQINCYNVRTLAWRMCARAHVCARTDTAVQHGFCPGLSPAVRRHPPARRSRFEGYVHARARACGRSERVRA